MKEAETYAADSHGDTLKCSLPSTQTTTTTTRAIKMNAACVCDDKQSYFTTQP